MSSPSLPLPRRAFEDASLLGLFVSELASPELEGILVGEGCLEVGMVLAKEWCGDVASLLAACSEVEWGEALESSL